MLRRKPNATQPAGEKGVHQYPEYFQNIYQELVALQEIQTKKSPFSFNLLITYFSGNLRTTEI